MINLNEPTPQLAARILDEVDFEHRFIGFKMHYRLGPMEVALYSFEEILGLLGEPCPCIDFKELEAWLRSNCQDHELADRIAQETSTPASDMEKTSSVSHLLAIRLMQCKRIV